MPPGYRLRALRGDDVPLICALEWRAAQAFADHGYPAIAAEPPGTPAQFHERFRTCDVTVAASDGDVPAGFIATLTVGGWLWVTELSVDPDHARKGLTSALLDAAARDSERTRLAGLALSTFAGVPFNGPFYTRRSFIPVDPASAPPELAARWRHEIPPGVKPEDRLLMIRPRKTVGT